MVDRGSVVHRKGKLTLIRCRCHDLACELRGALRRRKCVSVRAEELLKLHLLRLLHLLERL